MSSLKYAVHILALLFRCDILIAYCQGHHESGILVVRDAEQLAWQSQVQTFRWATCSHRIGQGRAGPTVKVAYSPIQRTPRHVHSSQIKMAQRSTLYLNLKLFIGAIYSNNPLKLRWLYCDDATAYVRGQSILKPTASELNDIDLLHRQLELVWCIMRDMC